MVKRIIKFTIAALGMLVGFYISDLLIENKLFVINSNVLVIVFYAVLMLAFGFLFYIISPFFVRWVTRLVDSIEKFIVNEPKETLIIGFLGFISGIIIAFLLSIPMTFLQLPSIFEVILTVFLVILYVTLGMVGYRIAIKYKNDIIKLFTKKKIKDENEKKSVIYSKNIVTPKILDTSVLIDGRIEQISNTGFLEGDIIIPNFVLEELQLIADSKDELKRERGRRGLDIVKELQNSKFFNLKISKKDYKDVDEVDIKLLKFANEFNSSIITNDFNLNKLAQVQGIRVLNINELANSVKTIVIPGEKMIVNIIKEGKEKNQGLAYLEDGTMIVVEEGKNLIGMQVEVVVSTVLQTAAGKMIFTTINEK